MEKEDYVEKYFLYNKIFFFLIIRLRTYWSTYIYVADFISRIRRTWMSPFCCWRMFSAKKQQKVKGKCLLKMQQLLNFYFLNYVLEINHQNILYIIFWFIFLKANLFNIFNYINHCVFKYLKNILIKYFVLV